MTTYHTVAENFTSSLLEVKTFHSEKTQSRELAEAVDLLNELIAPISKMQQFKVGLVCNQVLLVDLRSDSIIRVLPTFEVLLISRSLTKILDLQMH